MYCIQPSWWKKILINFVLKTTTDKCLWVHDVILVNKENWLQRLINNLMHYIYWSVLTNLYWSFCGCKLCSLILFLTSKCISFKTWSQFEKLLFSTHFISDFYSSFCMLQLAANWRHAELDGRQRAILEFAIELCHCRSPTPAHHQALGKWGLTEEDSWDIGAIVALFALSNRYAFLTEMKPNAEFHLFGRIDQPKAWVGLITLL